MILPNVRADGFVALPGGIGTLEELVEQLTWAQLGRHRKPILLANIKGYWDPLLTLIDHMRAQQFLPAVPRVDCLVADRVEDILPKLRDAARDVTDADVSGLIGRPASASHCASNRSNFFEPERPALCATRLIFVTAPNACRKLINILKL
jgi:hypothetical protein